MSARANDDGAVHPPTSRALHAVAGGSERSWVAVVVVAIVAVMNVILIATGYPIGLVYPFEVAGTSVALVMLFVIRHTQGRQQEATQLKLDELIHAMPRADDEAMKLEQATDAEISARADRQDEVRGEPARRVPGPMTRGPGPSDPGAA